MNYLSVIIRTLNEAKWLAAVLEAIKCQSVAPDEIIVVDSGSTDGTKEIASRYGCKIWSIPKDSFNYSYASNFGAQKAQGDFLVFLSGHSVLANPKALEDALHHFEDATVAGVYGDMLALPDGSIWEKAFHYLGYVVSRLKGPQVITRPKQGVLSCTNAIIRRNLWQQHPFEERFGCGGEDMAWAIYWLKQNWKIIKEPKFLVFHSHGSSFVKFIKEMEKWKSWTLNVFQGMGIK